MKHIHYIEEMTINHGSRNIELEKNETNKVLHFDLGKKK